MSYKYNAFISFTHIADKETAKALQIALQKFAKPFYKRVALNVFRDEDEIAPGESLSDKIKDSLDNSEYFVLLASPASASNASWVPREVEYWLEKHSSTRKDKENPPNFIIVLTDGEIQWNNEDDDFNWNKTTALPDVLKKQFCEEPLYIDFRNIKKDYLLLSLKDVIDWPVFLERLKEQKGLLEKYVYDLFQEDNRRFINEWGRGKPVEDELKFSILNNINKLIQRRDFYPMDKPDIFKKINVLDILKEIHRIDEDKIKNKTPEEIQNFLIEEIKALPVCELVKFNPGLTQGYKNTTK